MMFGKKSITFLVIFAIITFMVSYCAYATFGIDIFIDGKKVEVQDSPFIHNGRTLVPLRAVGDVLGAEILWDSEKSIAIAKNEETVVEFSHGKESIKVNGEEIKLDTSPFIVKDKMFVPLRAVAESFGKTVSFDGKRGIINISGKNPLKVHFLYAGQADSSFIELPDNKCMLIDAGTADFGKELVSFIKKLGYEKIDTVIATHPHADHIGGMSEILKSFEIGHFYMPKKTHTSQTFENMISLLQEKKIKTNYAKSGDVLFDEDAKCTVLAPVRNDYERMNNHSLVLKLTYGETEILFSADAEIDSELDMLEKNLDLDSDVLKAGHHGSDSSSTDMYINEVSPESVVISVGKDNPYDFPSPSVLELFDKKNINVYRTDILGTVVLETDGFVYTIN